MAIAEIGGQKVEDEGSDVAARIIPYPNDVAAGSLLINVGAVWHANGVNSVTAALNSGTATIESFTTLLGSTGVSWAGGVGKAFICYSTVITPGSLSLIVSTNEPLNNYYQIAIDEFSGVDSTPLDVNGGEALFGAATGVTDTISTLTANSLIIGVIVTDEAVTAFTDGSGYTNIYTDPTGTQQPSDAMFRIVTTAASYNVDWSWTGSSRSSSVINAAFKPLGGGPPGPGPIPARRLQSAWRW